MGCCQSKPAPGTKPSTFRDIKKSKSGSSTTPDKPINKTTIRRRRSNKSNKHNSYEEEITRQYSVTSDDTTTYPSISSRRRAGRNRSNTLTSKGDLTDEDPYSYTDFDIIYRGDKKIAIIVAINFYDDGCAFVNCKVNQVTSLLVKYCDYKQDEIIIINNDTLIGTTLEMQLTDYIKNDESTHYFISVITDHPLKNVGHVESTPTQNDKHPFASNDSLNDSQSYQITVDPDNIPTDDLLSNLTLLNDNSSFFFLLDSPILGVMPRLKYRLMDNDTIQSELPESNEISFRLYSVMSLSACITQSDNNGVIVSSYPKSDSQLIDELAKLMVSERVETYNWIKLALKLQKIITNNDYTNESVSISSNQRDYLMENVSL